MPTAGRSSRLASSFRLWIVAALLVSAGAFARDARADSNWQNDQMWIVGFGGGNPYLSRTYTEINDAGFDIIANIDSSTISGSIQLSTVLDQLHTASPSTFHLSGMLCYGNPVSYAVWSQNYQAICNYPNIAQSVCDARLVRGQVKSYFVWDEPCSFGCGNTSSCPNPGDSCFPNVAAAQDVVNNSACTAGAMPYVNLLPIQGMPCNVLTSCGGSPTDVYRCYLDTYLRTYDGKAHPAPLLSMDSYPFEQDGNNDPAYADYFEGLKVQRDEAARYSTASQRVPMWVVIQLARHTSPHVNNTQPTLAQIRGQAYSALVYGATGIEYFTLAPYPADTVLYTDGLFVDDSGDTSATSHKYSGVKALNGELHQLGKTLVHLQPIATYHQATLGQAGIDDDVLGASGQVYDIVKSMTASNSGTEGMVGYFKDRTNGTDYLLVVNKSQTAARTFTLTLSNAATVWHVNKATGALDTKAIVTNNTKFNTISIAAGSGELYQIADNVSEYLAKVHAIAVGGDLTYYAHDKGVLAVSASTGMRYSAHDGAAYTPAVALAVDSATVDVCYKSASGWTGSVAAYDATLQTRTSFQPLEAAGPTSVLATGGTTYVGYRTAAGGFVDAYDTNHTRFETAATGLQVNDLAFDFWSPEIIPPGGSPELSIMVGHQGGVSRYHVAPGMTLMGARVTQRPIVDVEVDPPTGDVFLAKDTGSQGALLRVDHSLGDSIAFWSDGGNKPRVLRAVLSPGGSQIVAATIKSSPGKFFRLAPSQLAPLSSYVPASLPNTAFVNADLSALFATDLGVVRVDATNTPFAARPAAADERPASPIRPSVEAFPNPTRSALTFRLQLPVAGPAELTIYDVAGRVVARPVDGWQAAGVHDVAWRPAERQTGVYFYRFRANGVVDTRRLVVVK